MLFMDMVAYSRLPMDHQLLAGRRLMEIVQNLPEFKKKARAAGDLVSLWTGDGMALTFFGEFTDAVHCARQIVLGLKPEDGFTLRIGIHTGPVYRVATSTPISISRAAESTSPGELWIAVTAVTF